MSEVDESQGFERTHNILSINQNSLGAVACITNRLKSTLKQRTIVARGRKQVDYRLLCNLHTTYYDNAETKKIDCEYTYATSIVILTRHTMSFDNAYFFAQLRHPTL